MLRPPYFNTNLLKGEDLKAAVSSAEKQEAAILLIYKNSPARKFTPWEIHGMMKRAGKMWPITSCRRAITNLMNDGHLIKTQTFKIGELGKPEHYYKLKN